MPLRPVLLRASAAFALLASAAIAQAPQRVANVEEIAQWARLGHANAASESFAHWNDEGAIPPVCATCHSGAGFRSLHGLDGSDPGLPQSPVPVGGVVDCDTCHNPGLPKVSAIALPSGKQHPVTGYEAACMTCHQGRASTATITEAVAGRAEDEVAADDLRFINPHHAVAAASLPGSAGALGYQYPGRDYEPRFTRARPVSTCVSCHEPHNLTVAEDTA